MMVHGIILYVLSSPEEVYYLAKRKQSESALMFHGFNPSSYEHTPSAHIHSHIYEVRALPFCLIKLCFNSMGYFLLPLHHISLPSSLMKGQFFIKNALTLTVFVGSNLIWLSDKAKVRLLHHLAC